METACIMIPGNGGNGGFTGSISRTAHVPLLDSGPDPGLLWPEFLEDAPVVRNRTAPATYVKEAVVNGYNALLLGAAFVGTALAGPVASATSLLVGQLVLVAVVPRMAAFRRAVDEKIEKENRIKRSRARDAILSGLDADRRRAFARLEQMVARMDASHSRNTPGTTSERVLLESQRLLAYYASLASKLRTVRSYLEGGGIAFPMAAITDARADKWQRRAEMFSREGGPADGSERKAEVEYIRQRWHEAHRRNLEWIAAAEKRLSVIDDALTLAYERMAAGIAGDDLVEREDIDEVISWLSEHKGPEAALAACQCDVELPGESQDDDSQVNAELAAERNWRALPGRL